jgi:3-polyprenyl-4-hydroxybenzoate decarboxylase
LDLKNIKSVLIYILERVVWERDLFIFTSLSMDTLDYSTQVLEKGAKAALVGIGEKRRELRNVFDAKMPVFLKCAKIFCPGVLLLSGAEYKQEPELIKKIAAEDHLKDWGLIVLVDDVSKMTTDASFLWTTFTRFEPGRDMICRGQELKGNQIYREAPLVIDARTKPWFPEELFCDFSTEALVSSRWLEYFPHQKIEMGDSKEGHLYV